MTGANLQITDKRRKWDAVVDSIADAPGSTVKFGSVGSAASKIHQPRDPNRKAEHNVATILAFHEYGAGVPRRSVIAAWVEENKRQIGDAFRTGVLQQLAGVGNTEGTLDLIGKLAAEGMERRIRGFIDPELGDWARRDPYRDQRLIPLLDTEQILQSIGFESEV